MPPTTGSSPTSGSRTARSQVRYRYRPDAVATCRARQLWTLTVIGAETRKLPAASNARLRSWYAPSGNPIVPQNPSQPKYVSAPGLTTVFDSGPPVTRNSTRVTLTLSRADATTAAVPRTVALAAGTSTLVVGFVKSTVTETGVERPTFPASSCATATSW